eukprot:scaffold57655_cov19-Prasinocladus_malaysianus.AAC.1
MAIATGTNIFLVFSSDITPRLRSPLDTAHTTYSLAGRWYIWPSQMRQLLGSPVDVLDPTELDYVLNVRSEMIHKATATAMGNLAAAQARDIYRYRVRRSGHYQPVNKELLPGDY